MRKQLGVAEILTANGDGNIPVRGQRQPIMQPYPALPG
jgi:hypothetical protein